MRFDTEYRVGANTGPAERNLRGLVATARSTGAGIASGLGAGTSGIGKLTLALGAAGAATAALTTLPGIIREVVSEASEIGKVADQIGVTTQFLQELTFVASLYGVSQADTTKALEQFNKRVGEALTGTGNLEKILKANNVQLRDQNGNLRSTDDLLADYADLIARAASQQEKAFLATEAFGRSGTRMINVLQNGRGAFRDAIQDAKDLGVALEDDLIREAEALDDRWNAFTTSLSTNFKTAVLEIVSAADSLINALDRSVPAQQQFLRNPTFRNFIRSQGGETLADKLTAVPPDERIARAFGDAANAPANPKLTAALQQHIARRLGDVTRLPPPEDNKKDKPSKGTGGGRGGGSRRISSRGGSASSGPNALDREIDRIRQRTDLLRNETSVQAALNPLVEDYGLIVERGEQQQRLLNAAKQAGISITPTLRNEIFNLSAAYAEAKVESEKLADSQDEIRRRAEEFSALGQDVTRGLIDDLRNGVDAAEAFENALGKIADKLLDDVLSAIFQVKGASGGGGLFGGLLGGGSSGPNLSLIPAIFGGTFARGGISDRAAVFGEAGPEAAVPLPDGRRIPVDLRLPVLPSPAAPQSEPATVINFNPVIDARGADQAAVARLEQQMREQSKALGKEVNSINRRTQVRNLRG